MSTKTVSVVINGEEHVSEITQQAGASLTVFGKKIPLFVDPVQLATQALDLLRDAIASVKAYVTDSFRAYDEFSASNARMAAQAKITGVSLGEMRSVSKTLREEYGVSAVAANDLATTIAQYSAATEGAIKPNDLLRKAVDLGAASKMDAAQVSEALQQALRGEDAGFDKLLKRNPKSFWEEYAVANGLAVGKMTDAQKRIAELTAVMDAGNKVQGAAADLLNTAAGAQGKLNNELEDSKVAFGAALQPARLLVLNGLSALLSVVTPVTVSLAKLTNFLVEVFVGSFKLAQSAVGSVIEVVGKLAGISSLEQWGKKNSQAMAEYTDRLAKMHQQGQKSNDTVQESAKVHQLAAVQVTAHADAAEKGGKKAEDAAQAYYDKASKTFGAPLKTIIGMTEGALLSLAAAAKDQLPPSRRPSSTRICSRWPRTPNS